jgi:two-component system, NarL family, sensor kinase
VKTTSEWYQALHRIQKENQRLFHELMAQERRFRGLAKAVWRVQEEQRRQLAGELHDGLGQTLTALKIQLERLRDDWPADEATASRRVAGSVDLAATALAEARRLSRWLRPQVLDDLGLVPALTWLARSLGEWTGFEATLELPGSAPAPERLDPDLETLLFRVAQEGLNNALKHSGVGGAVVTLEVAPRRVSINIRDEGQGFDTATLLRGAEGGPDASEAHGSGLAGLKERVRVFGGRLTLVSRPGAGTTMEAVIHLVPDDEDEGNRVFATLPG